MKTRIVKFPEETVAATVPPEDLRCGDYIAVLQEVVEFPTFLLGECGIGSTPFTRIATLPRKPVAPLRVEAICLPYVFVKHPRNRHRTLDVRQCQLARIHPDYAKAVWKILQPNKV